MDKLLKILESKNFPHEIVKLIISLYDESVKFWGEENQELILKTIEDFEIILVDNLEEKIEEVFAGKVNQDGVGKNNPGLCVVIPTVHNQQIINLQRYILLDSRFEDKELSSILAHELFFHGVKSMIQPYIYQNTLMTGLELSRFSYDTNNNVVNIEKSEGRGLEEISTYFGQNLITNSLYNENVKMDPLLLDIANSVGSLLQDTSLGKIILQAQLDKNTEIIEEKFDEVDNYRITLLGEAQDKITWKEYNNLMDKFMDCCTKIYTTASNGNDYNLLLEEYIKAYKELMNLNFRIYSAALLMDSNKSLKKTTNN